MERIDPKKIDKAVLAFVREMGLEAGFKRYHIMKAFNESAGVQIAKLVTKKQLDGKKLTIYISSSIARNVLLMRRAEIIKQINYQMQETVVDEIILR